MSHKIEFRPSALRSLRKLARHAQIRIGSALDALAQNPFPPGVKKLISEDNVYRIRVGDYRVIYQVESEKLLILVLKVGHRKEVYR